MIFSSKYANYQIGVNVPGGHKKLCFVNGLLDTTSAAQSTGLSERKIIEVLKSSRYFGIDFDEKGGVGNAN